MKKTYIYLTVALAIITIVIVGYAFGYRLDNFNIVQSPIIQITVPHKDSLIFLNNQEYKKTSKDFQTVTIRNTKAGDLNIIVSHEGRWPWTKTIKTKNGESYELTPFNLVQTISPEIITENDARFNALALEIEQTKKPTKENPVTSFDGKMSMYLIDRTIYITWNGTLEEIPEIFCTNNECKRTVSLQSFITDIHSAALYPGHNDRLIIAANSFVSILEIDKPGSQNFQYVLQGQSPLFMLKSNRLFILDNKAVAEVILE